MKSISRRKAKGGFFCVGAGDSGGIRGGAGPAGGEGGSLLGCVAVGMDSPVSGVGCSGDGGVGLSLLGPVPVFGSL